MATSANHFFWRAGFGPITVDIYPTPTFDAPKNFNAWWQASSKPPLPLIASKNVVDGLSNGVSNFGRIESANKEQKETRQQMLRQSREDIRSLNLMWLDEMVDSAAQLREKMALFWHGHFACRNLNSYYQQQLLHTIREGALGNFGELLKNVSQSAAMLAFLNNQQNRKQSPNENFAREVMELFTVGRGNYSEQDIKEAARAFTGWGFNLNGEFVFRKQFHDTGTKTVLGVTGQHDGEDVLNILLDQPATAVFIVRKLYKFLVNEKVDEDRVQKLAKSFHEGGYEIKPLLKDILTSKWFYEKENTGSKIKSPVELWVGIRRVLPMELDNPPIQLLLQRALGQILLYPPSVAGWPGGTNWIDSSSLLLRMRLPHLVALAEPFSFAAKSDDDVSMGRENMGDAQKIPQRFKLKGDIDWDSLIKRFEKVPDAQLIQAIPTALLQSKQNPMTNLASRFKSQDRITSIMQITIATMATPEFQLC
jgi:uncharacterized protein (DUF1800 family)